MQDSADAYSCHVAATLRYDTHDAKPIIFLGRPPILLIHPSRNVAQVANSIVRPDAVDVVNLVFWDASGRVKPCQTVGLPPVSVNPNNDVSVMVNPPSGVANVYSFVRFNAPCKHACFWIVVKNFAQTLCGKIGLSHDAPRMLIG